MRNKQELPLPQKTPGLTEQTGGKEVSPGISHGKLDGAEGGVDAQQDNALRTGQLAPLQCGKGHDHHDSQHDRDLQHKAGIDAKQGRTLRHGKGCQRDGHAADQHQIEHVCAHDVAKGQVAAALDQRGDGGDQGRVADDRADGVAVGDLTMAGDSGHGGHHDLRQGGADGHHAAPHDGGGRRHRGTESP